jgi:hypothetical protein
MGCTPSKADSDIWMKDCRDHYEYIACYVDDLLIASKNVQAIIDALEAKPNSFKLKGTGPATFHLGNDSTMTRITRYDMYGAQEVHRTYGHAVRRNVWYETKSYIHFTLDEQQPPRVRHHRTPQ